MTSKEVVNWEEELAKQAREVAQLERPAVATISLRGGIMMYEQTQVPGNEIECVIIGSSHERTYYAESFDPDTPQSPVCFAQTIGETCTVPHEKSTNPQNTTCAGCPMDQWGSADRGRGKGCKEIRKLIIMPISALASEESVGRSELAIIRVPVTSVKNFSAYANQIASMYSRPPWAVKSKIKVGPHPKNQFTVSFTYSGPVDSEVFPALVKRQEAVNGILLTPYEPVEEREEEPAPAKGKKKY